MFDDRSAALSAGAHMQKRQRQVQMHYRRFKMPDFKIKLLIVDDEPATRLLLSQIFSNMGHEVAAAEDGFDALRQMRQTMPDIILSDLNMPGMSGFEFLSVIRRRLPAIYVIATSGAYSGSNVPNGIAADAFYEKASGLKTLLKIMEAAANTELSGQRDAFPIAPIWVSNHPISYPHLNWFWIGCPECLRSFPCSDDAATTYPHSVVCEYCGAQITYAVVAIIGAVSELPYQRQLDHELAQNRQNAMAD
jgi:CheY-like chemotaxis protein